MISEDYRLASDEDWTSDASVLVKDGVTVDLNGHSLASPLPKVVSGDAVADGYVQLGYVEATGWAGKQWINTGYIPASTDRVEMDISTTGAVTSNQFLFCSRGSTVTANSFSCLWLGGVLRFDRATEQNKNTNTTSSEDTRYLIAMDGNTLKCSVNGKDVCTLQSTAFTPVNPLVLFASYLGAAGADVSTFTSWMNWAYCRLYSFKVYDKDGALKCDAVPACRTSDGAVGLYDKERGRFLENGSSSPLLFPEASGAEATITNGAEGDAAEFTLTVPSGGSVTNNCVALSGNLKLVKAGAGTYTPARKAQSYAGGTEIKAGLLRVVENGSLHTLGAEGSEITVSADGDAAGVIDMNGHPGYPAYKFTGNGGAIRNSVAVAEPWKYSYIGDLRLAADSSFDSWQVYGLVGASYTEASLDLAGHTLYVNKTTPPAGSTRNFLLTNVKAVSAGSIESWGNFYFYGSAGDKARTPSDLRLADVVVNGQMRTGIGDAASGTLIAKLGNVTVNTPTADVANASGAVWEGKVQVYGAFRPNTDYFRGVELQDGATLDLRGRTGTFDTKGKNVGVREVQTTVTFAANAAVGVNVAGRGDLRSLAASDSPYVVKWATQPTGVKFALDDETKAGYRLKSDAAGLKISRAGGMTIVIR